MAKVTKAQPAAKKARKVVSAETTKVELAQKVTPDYVPTPTEYVREAQKLAKDALESIERSGFCLEDGVKFFEAFEDPRRKDLIQGIAGYLQKAHFAAHSLADEITIALGEQPGAKKAQSLPKLVMDTPSLPTETLAPAAAEKPPVAALEQSATLFELTVLMLNEMEISGANAERMVQVLQFQRRCLTDVKAALAAVKGVA